MAAWILLVTFVPIAMIESVWSDFQNVHERQKIKSCTLMMKDVGVTETEKTK